MVWSPHPSREAWSYIESSGVMDDWEQRFKAKEVAIERVDDYLESIQMYVEGRADGCAMYLFDALTLPALRGVDSTILFVVGFSRGAERVVLRSDQDISGLRGRSVRVEQFSPAHYLLIRALEVSGLQRKDISIINTREQDIPPLFVLEANNKNRGAASVGGGSFEQIIGADREAVSVFDSSMLPGEIISVLVVRSELADEVKRAVAGAWFETMQVLGDKNDSGREEILEGMVSSSPMESRMFKSAFKKQKIFYLAREAAAFTKSYKLKAAIRHMHDFAEGEGFYRESGTSADNIGVLFPDGEVMGARDNIKLRIEERYMRMASDWLN